MQTILPLGNSAGLKLTTARYYTPAGRSIQAKGIEPDIAMDDGRDSPNRVREANLGGHLEQNKQLEKAIRSQPPGASAEPTAPAQAASPSNSKAAPSEPAKAEPPLPRFDFGSADDFQLRQAINHLKGQPIIASIRAQTAASTQPATTAAAATATTK